jgi:hypothetical protein
LDLKNPITFNEKIQWIKLYDRRDIHTLYADKYKVRNFLSKKYGTEYLVPLVMATKNYKDISYANMPDYPVIIKPNHASGWYHIIKDKSKVDWHKIQTDCRCWLNDNYYYFEKEWQYKNIEPCIVVEKLLMGNNGEIPNNYRLHCMNGNVEIVSVNIYQSDNKAYSSGKYNKNWEYLDFRFGTEAVQEKIMNLKQPLNLNKMISIAEDIAKDFHYVRVDFYEVEGKLYYGEITLHDSSGYDKIIPFDWDTKFGKLIPLK